MITVRGQIDDRAVEQLQRCVDAEEGSIGALLPDGHVGYSMPIGGVVGYRDHLSPSGVGYDIGCGNKAVMTDLHYDDVRYNLSTIADLIYKRVSFGVGRVNDEPIDDPVLHAIEAVQDDLPWMRGLLPKAQKQLGTVGSGNHYVDLFRDEKDRVWVGVHFGSRGFGHAIASGFLSLAAGQKFEDRIKEGEMDSPPTLIPVDNDLGQCYLESMRLAGDFAYAGRNQVCDRVLEILGATSLDEVHNHHNYTWLENHFGQDLWVVRKGATPAFPGQRGFVGSTMGEISVILRGLGGSVPVGQVGPMPQDALLNSTVHGAGRVMSRTQAAGKSKRRKRWGCPQRDCDYVSEVQPGKTNRGGPTNCPEHGLPLRQFRITEVTKKGEIDWDAARLDLKTRGIELRGAGADEAPGAYKRLPEVLGYVQDTVEVLHELRPIVVCMAGADTYDPWKD